MLIQAAGSFGAVVRPLHRAIMSKVCDSFSREESSDLVVESPRGDAKISIMGDRFY